MTAPDASPSRNAPCPCGSGKKYKKCCGAQAAVSTAPSRPRAWMGPLLVVGVAAVLLLGGQLVRRQSMGARTANATGPTNFMQIDGVDLGSLSDTQRVSELKTANRQRCTCGCRMTLAECINTDMTCPLRRVNFRQARTLVREARQGS